MYFYYGCSGIGIKLRVIRPWITSMQIVQFCTGLPYLYVVRPTDPNACHTVTATS